MGERDAGAHGDREPAATDARQRARIHMDRAAARELMLQRDNGNDSAGLHDSNDDSIRTRTDDNTTRCKVPHEAGGEQKSVRERHGYLRASHSDVSQCCRGTARNDRLEGCAGEGCTHVATSDGASSTR